MHSFGVAPDKANWLWLAHRTATLLGLHNFTHFTLLYWAQLIPTALLSQCVRARTNHVWPTGRGSSSFDVRTLRVWLRHQGPMFINEIVNILTPGFYAIFLSCYISMSHSYMRMRPACIGMYGCEVTTVFVFVSHMQFRKLENLLRTRLGFVISPKCSMLSLLTYTHIWNMPCLYTYFVFSMKWDKER